MTSLPQPIAANENEAVAPALDRARDVPHGTTAVRLMSKVEVDPITGCWLWTGSKTPGGYGSIGMGSLTDGTRRLQPAHRVSYEIFVGPRRGDGGAHWSAKTQCPHGHPYDAENTRIYRGRRFCRECHRIRSRKVAA